MKYHAFAVVIGLLALSAGGARASGSVGATPLNLSAGARAEAMGGAFVAVSDDATALYWNPGALGQVSDARLSGAHTEWLGGVRYEWLGFAQPLGRYATFGVGAKFVTGGDIPRTLSTRGAYEESGAFRYGTRHVSFGVGSGRVGDFRFGGGFEVMNEGIAFSGAASDADELDTSVTAAHLGGLYYTPVDGLRVGCALRNIGEGDRLGSAASPLPRVLQVGCSYGIRIESTAEELPPELATTELPKEKTSSGEVTVAADLMFLREESPALRLGTEYRFRNGFAARAGYRTDGQFDAVSRLSGGFGYTTETYEVDYGFVPVGDLGNVHRVGFTLFFR